MDVSSLTALKGLLAGFIQRVSGESATLPNANA
jgi:hypothetical protein